MIKLTKRSYKLALDEFKKGKTFWVAENRDGNFTELIDISSMNEHPHDKIEMVYTGYYMDSGSKYGGPFTTPWSGWNWHIYNFYILSSEEKDIYFKTILANKIIHDQQ